MENQIKDVDCLGQFTLKEHADFFNGMGFRYERGKAQKDRGNNKQGGRCSIKPLHRYISQREIPLACAPLFPGNIDKLGHLYSSFLY